MSRSYKKTSVSTCGGRCGGTRKYWKIQANRKVRKERTLRNKSYKMSRPNVQKILYKNVQLVCLLYVVF